MTPPRCSGPATSSTRTLGGTTSCAGWFVIASRRRRWLSWSEESGGGRAEVHGTTIPAGERVALIFGAANRDELRWEDPEKLDIGRRAQRNLAFGEGIHHCLGAPVARLEGRVVLEEIVMSMPSFALDGPARRTSTYTTRGVELLPIAFST